MVQEELIRERLKLLEEYIGDLQQVEGISRTEYLENKVLRRFVERTLHLDIEACLDIGFHITSTEGYREPRFGREVVAILAENGWLDGELQSRLEGMAGFRNVLVHDYALIDQDTVLKVLQSSLPDRRDFGLAIADRLDDRWS